MKIVIIIAVTLVIGVVCFQAYMSKASSDVEQHKYTVIKKYKDFEVRQYETAIFSSVKMPNDTYKESANQGFRTLAGYIFGGNDKNEKIAMTSPVAMELGDSTKMSFMVPSGRSMESLPKPNSSKITFEKQEGKKMAAIEFDGWADDKRIADYTERLRQALKAENIQHTGKFIYFGYNAPFDLVNRRNEIAVEVLN
jgi:hypothetical protein